MKVTWEAVQQKINYDNAWGASWFDYKYLSMVGRGNLYTTIDQLLQFVSMTLQGHGNRSGRLGGYRTNAWAYCHDTAEKLTHMFMT